MAQQNFIPEQSPFKENTVGIVIGYNVAQDSIKILLNPQYAQSLELGEPIVVTDDSKQLLFFSILTNIYQQPTNAILNFAKYGNTMLEGIGEKNASLQDRGFERMADLSCLKITKSLHSNHIQRTAFNQPPPTLSLARKPTAEELQLIYANEKMKRYWIGSILSCPDLMIPLDMKRMIESQTGIFGRTNSGKTVTTRNLCKAVVHDPSYELNTSILIFDVMNEYAVGTVSAQAGNRGLLQYPQLRNKIMVFGLDDHHAEINHVKGVAGYDYRTFYIFKDSITASDILSLLEKQQGFSDLMRVAIFNIEGESFKRKRANLPHASFYDTLLEFYEAGWENDNPHHISHLARNEASYTGLQFRLRQFLDEHSFLNRFLRDRPQGDTQSKDAFETMKYYLNHERPADYFEDDQGVSHEVSRSFIIYFGSYGSNAYAYDFIANVLGRKFYDLYSKNEQYVLPDGTRKFRNLIILLEEAHKFIGKETNSPIFEALARETRKYGLTLWIVDQLPGSLKPEITEQLANRITHRLTGSDHVRVALAGLDADQWFALVKKLNKGECIVFGDLINDIPTVLHSYFPASPDHEEQIRFMEEIIQDQSPISVTASPLSLKELGTELLKHTKKAKVTFPSIEKQNTIPAIIAKEEKEPPTSLEHPSKEIPIQKPIPPKVFDFDELDNDGNLLEED